MGKDLLSAIFGAAGPKAQALLDGVLRLINARLADAPEIQGTQAAMKGLYFGPTETSQQLRRPVADRQGHEFKLGGYG